MVLINNTYHPWPESGEGFSLGCRTVLLAATNLAALAVRLYVILCNKSELPFLIPTISICASHVFMIAQSVTLTAACYYGWGSAIETLPVANLHEAEKESLSYFFASNVLLLLVHGCSRTSIGITLILASNTFHNTRTSTFAKSILYAIPVWTIGSILGLVLQRVVGQRFWLSISKDCSFELWAVVSLLGLIIDVAVAACAVPIIIPLKMAFGKKVYTILVFGIGILVIIPTAFGLAHLYRAKNQIFLDAPLHTAPFIYANQAAIATSLWCRALEVAVKFRQDIGYASYGLRDFSLSSLEAFTSGRRDTTATIKQQHNVTIEAGETADNLVDLEGITVQQETDYTEDYVSSDA